MPEFLKAPPSVVALAPETVMPDMLKLPPVAMSKIRKLRKLTPLLPLMVRLEAPGPVMVRVPAVPPPVIGVVASIMIGNCVFNKVMVPAPPENREEAKSMVSLPAVVLARVMASRRVPPVGVSAKEVT